MAQQQYFLVILVLLLVSIATVLAFTAFKNGEESSNVQNVKEELNTLVTYAQGYYIKPAMLGGGGRSFERFTFDNIPFLAHNITDDGKIAESEYGRYEVTEGISGRLTVTAHPASCTGFRPGTKDENGSFTVHSGSGCKKPLVAKIKPNDVILASVGME